MATDVTVIVTARGRDAAAVDAVRSVLRQTVLPTHVIVVDDGSADAGSLEALADVASMQDAQADDARMFDERLALASSAPDVRILHAPGAGVTAARNLGIAAADTLYIAVLDAGDLLRPRFLECTVPLLRADRRVAAASSWFDCYGVLDGEVRPCGGTIVDFLPRDCCPSTRVFRRDQWRRCGGYDETMRDGFEDWDFALGLLESCDDARSAGCAVGDAAGDEPADDAPADGGPARVVVVGEPLISHRTDPDRAGIATLRRRPEQLARLIERHRESYAAHVAATVLAMDALAVDRLRMWEDAVQVHPELLQHSMRTRAFMEHPTFGDGGLDAAIRINRARCSAPYYPSDVA